MDTNSTKPLVFLNVDGVLTSARTYWQPGGSHRERIDPIALKLAARFIEEMGAEAIMASQWSNMFCRTPLAWRDFFASMGVSIPVIHSLPSGMETVNRSWAELTEDFMMLFPNRPYVLFEDDPEEAGRPNLVIVDARVGLTTVDLEKAAHLLAPGGRMVKELASLNKSFSMEATIDLSFGGATVSVHPRDVGKGLEQLGVLPQVQ